VIRSPLFRHTLFCVSVLSLLSPASAQEIETSSPVREGRRVSPDEPLAPKAESTGTDLDTAERFETHRIRIVNAKDGAIQVSTDKGKTWRLIGRVLVPATTVAGGYLASRYAPSGTVAASAVHGLRLRVGIDDPTSRFPQVVAIEPLEYTTDRTVSGYTPNKGFGGYVAGSAGIFTDIPAGTSLFRDLAPIVGCPVYRESNTGRMFPLPESFRPMGFGETIVLFAMAPRNSLTQVTFENKAGGAVEATFADGTTKQICTVLRPVQGVGRFDGTTYTGVGRINTAHTGVITVSTAPQDRTRREGEGKERRGGFQISPDWHNSQTEEAGSPVVMSVGSPGPRHREMEGQPPLFRDMIGLDDESAKVEVSIDNGPFEPMPEIVGARQQGFTATGLNIIWKEQGIARRTKQGVTAFRITLPKRDAERFVAATNTAVEKYHEKRLIAAKTGRIPLVNGLLTINANPTNAADVAMVRFSVEGQPRGFTNIAPFALTWDTTRVPDGEYLIEAEAMDTSGTVLATTRRRVFVLNQRTPRPNTATASAPNGQRK
jgi:hypothetical protein